MNWFALGGRWGWVVAFAVGGLGCGPSVTDVASDTDPVEDDGDADGDDDGAGQDATGAPDGGVIEGGSCAGLDPGGPTIGGGEVGASGFPPSCNPRVDGGPVGAYTCCSDDPAAPGGALPNYAGKDVPEAATPFFSGVNNAIGTSGLCVKTAEVPVLSTLEEAAAAGCPIPCDPAWSGPSVESVCGAGHACCQTQEIEEPDCILDPASDKWRPVDGTDIGTKYESGAIVTTWAPGEHGTHQDPGGTGCAQLAGGDPSSATFLDCVQNLHVANHRGVCVALQPGQLCPLTAKADACTLLNEG